MENNPVLVQECNVPSAAARNYHATARHLQCPQDQLPAGASRHAELTRAPASQRLPRDLLLDTRGHALTVA
jgi:hypothetical protein